MSYPYEKTPEFENCWPSVHQMIAMSDEELSSVDPVVMNLVVAKGIPSLTSLDIGQYVQLADMWGADLQSQMPELEVDFQQAPHRWRNDIRFFRLGLVCRYIDLALDVKYREDQRGVKRILYTDPTDLFLNGVMDTRRGTCGNMALLNVVLGRRVGLSVSLACVGAHLICRYDDGVVTHNIEATQTGGGGFGSGTDEEIMSEERMPEKARGCGSELRAVTPREMLGLFLGARARHLENTNRLAESEPDYLLARYLFPRNRYLYISQNQISVQCSIDMFEPGEKGHPIELARWLQEVVRVAPWKRKVATTPLHKTEHSHDLFIDLYFQSLLTSPQAKGKSRSK